MPFKTLLALLALVCASTAQAADRFVDLTARFATFADLTATLPDDQRFARFNAEIAPLFPSFYEPHEGEAPDRYRQRVLKSLQDFPALRARYAAAQKAFPAAYTAGIAHFRETFPDFREPEGVFFIHSLGEMDGGTRTLHGRSYLIFGADGIARYHDPDSIGAFFDHELFHVEHARHFTDCDPVWCGLWQEGLATYAASLLNPGSSDQVLMLATPKPIRAPVDARWRDALCLLDAKRNSIAKEDYGLFFFGNPNTSGFPSRLGYYLGFRLAQRAGKSMSLQQMAALDHAAAQALVEKTLATMIGEAGGCSPPQPRNR